MPLDEVDKSWLDEYEHMRGHIPSAGVRWLCSKLRELDKECQQLAALHESCVEFLRDSGCYCYGDIQCKYCKLRGAI